MPELLLEVGCEELPASFIEQAANDLRDAVAERLVETGLGQAEDAEALGKEATVLSTPRRLIVSFPDVASRQPDRVDEKRGPSLKASYDASGASTQALIGFCRSVGLEPAQLRQEGDYVWASKPVAGRSAPEVLAELLPEAIRSLSFAKSMRWGSGRMRFARPIRWILAAFDGEAVEFEIEGVRSGLTSRGHRFLSPDPFEARSLAPLLVGLRQREVEPDAEQRKKKIEAELRALGFDDQLEESDEEPPGSEHEPLEEYLQRQHRRSVVKELIRENVGLAEWPRAVAGHFRPEYLPLPAVVLEATMAKHEKMFPIWDESGKVTNRFVFVANSGDDDTVRAGAEWVLNARFGDAKFFYDEDLKHDMNYFLARTKTIVFHEKLGSVRQRAGRLELLVQAVALDTAGDHAAPNLGLAGKYSKADLASGLVSELPDLQGRIGAEYVMQAHSFGDSTKAISDVIKYQYDPRAIRVYGCDDLPLGVADQLDILAGYLALGEAPSGSSDPHGLRRAAVLLIQSASSPLSKLVDGFENLIRSAIDGYERPDFNVEAEHVLDSACELFERRYEGISWKHVTGSGVRRLDQGELLSMNVIAAASERPYTGERWALNPLAAKRRVLALEEACRNEGFVQTMTRPLNIVGAAVRKGHFQVPAGRADLGLAVLEALSDVALGTQEAMNLKTSARDRCRRVAALARPHDALALIDELRALQAPINEFFDKTMVMSDDPAERQARLTLLHCVNLQILQAGDFSKLVFEG